MIVIHLSFLYVCMVNTIYLFSFVETPRKFIIAELSIRKLVSSSVLIILLLYLLSFVETPRKFIIAELSIRKLGSSSVLIILLLVIISINNINNIIISTDEDPSLRIESSAMINLRGVSTKLNKYIVFTMQTYKKLTIIIIIIIISIIISTDEDPSLRVERSAIINLRGVSTKLNKYVIYLHSRLGLNRFGA